MASAFSTTHEEDLGLAQKLRAVEKEGQISESSTTQKFYAVRRCKNLLKPAIFLAWEDCCPFLINEELEDDCDSDDDGGRTSAEYKTFDAMLDAFTYILNITSGNEPQHRSLVEAASALPPTQNAATAPQQGQSENEQSEQTSDQVPVVEAASALEQAQATATPQQQLANNGSQSENEQEHSQLVEKDSNVDKSTTAATMPQQPAGPPPVARSSTKRKRASRSSTRSKEKRAEVSSSPTKAVASKKPQSELVRRWNAKFEEVKAFKAVHGHCHIPKKFNENPALASWAEAQRVQHRRLGRGKGSAITLKRIRQLTNIGFKWQLPKDNMNTVKWAKRVDELKAFKAVHGHCDVPQKCDAFPGLPIWVSTQRTAHRHLREGKDGGSALTPERIQELTNLGFKWSVAKSETLKFEERLEQLAAYRAKHGHCNVPQYSNDKNIPQGLGNFVLDCRRMYKSRLKMLSDTDSTTSQEVGASKSRAKRPITQEEIEQLEAMGFQWQLRKRVSQQD